MDITPLGIKVDSSEVKDAVPALNDLTKAADKTENSVNDLNSATGKASKTQSEMEKQTNKLSNSLSGMGSIIKTAAIAFAGAFTVDVFKGAADSYTEFTNRLKVAGAEGDNFTKVQDRLFEAANKAGAPINALGTLYGRASLAADSLGASQDQLLNFVDGVSASLKVQGGSASSASGALMQLSQALGSGVVRAEEFNSILEGAPTIAQAAAAGWDGTGVSVAQLRTMILEGQVTSKQFFDAFLTGSESMKAQADALGNTLGQALTVLSNGFIRLVGTLDQASGASSSVANVIVAVGNGMSWLAQNIDVVIQHLIPLAPLLAATFGPYILGAVMSLSVAIGRTLVTSLITLWTTLSINPLTILLAGIVAIMGYMVDWQKSIAGLIKIWGAFVYAWNDFWGNEAGAQRGIEIVVNADKAAADLLQKGKEVANAVSGGFTSGGNYAAPKIEGAMVSGADKAAKTLVSAQERAVANYESLNGKVIKPLGDTLVEGGKYIYNQVTGSVTAAGDAAAKSLSTGVKTGGETASSQMQSAVASGGQQAASAISGEMGGFLQAIFRYSTNALEYIDRAIRAYIGRIEAEADKFTAESILATQQAMTERNNRNRTGFTDGRGSSSLGSGGGATGTMSSAVSGGSNFGVGKNLANFTNTWNKDQNFNGNEQPQQITQQTTVGGGANITVVNVTDPAETAAVMNTQQGNQMFINFVKNNREEVLAILGVSN